MAKKKIEPEPQAAQRFRNRIKELRMVKASELKRNPKNFRRHPDSQKKALEAVLSEVGYADALIAREDAEGLLLLDGHLRADLDSESMVPVLVLDVNEKEGDLILATLDPLAGLAEQDDEALRNLLEGIETENEELLAMFEAMANEDTGNAKTSHTNTSQSSSPENFKEFDENIKTDHTCPKCGYAWSGGK